MSWLLTVMLLAPASGVPWIANDSGAAERAAQARGKPILIDFWAPWCHTCLSMKRTVLTRAQLGPLVDDFVWLSVDTDRPENAALVERFPPNFWPTFLVLDAQGKVLARLAGGASSAQFKAFLAGAKAGDDPLATKLAGADALAAKGDYAGARAGYDTVLASAPAGWARRPDVLVSAITTRYRTKDWPACLEFAALHMANAAAGNSASGPDFTYFAGACADKAPGPAADGVRKAATLVIEKVLAHGIGTLSADDRSDALRLLRGHHLALEDEASARRAAERQVAVLDAAVSANPAAVLMAAWPRAEVYNYLGRAVELVPELTAATAAHPEAYNPPYRLAWVLLQTKQVDAAVEPAEAAARRAYGPRKLRVLQLLASIHEARADRMAQRDVAQRLVAAIEALPAAQQDPEQLAKAQAKLAALQ